MKVRPVLIESLTDKFLSQESQLPFLPRNNRMLRKITGRVTDTKGEPLIGVNVTVDGDTNGSITNMDGLFELRVSKKNAVLKFTYIGFNLR
mgnify:CR=1 FL=1